MYFISVMAKLNFQQPLLQSLVSMLKTVKLLNIFVKTIIYFFRILLYSIINVFTVTFDQFNELLRNTLNYTKMFGITYLGLQAS